MTSMFVSRSSGTNKKYVNEDGAKQDDVKTSFVSAEKEKANVPKDTVSRPSSAFAPKKSTSDTVESVEKDSPKKEDKEKLFSQDFSDASSEQSDNTNNDPFKSSDGGFDDDFFSYESEKEDSVFASENDQVKEVTVENTEEVVEQVNSDNSEPEKQESDAPVVVDEPEKKVEMKEVKNALSPEDLDGPELSQEELLQKFEALRQEHEKLQEKRTQFMTLAKKAKEDSAKIAKEVKQKLGIDTPEELENWLTQARLTEQKSLEKFEDDLKKARESADSIDKILEGKDAEMGETEEV